MTLIAKHDRENFTWLLFSLYTKIDYTIIVTGFKKTDRIVTFCISRNPKLKYSRYCSSLMLDCSHARFACTRRTLVL